MSMDSNRFAKLMEIERHFGFPSRHENKYSYFIYIAIDELMSCGLSDAGALGVISLYERLREEGLNQEEATKVVEEEVEIQSLEAKGMTRSDAQKERVE